MSRMRTSANVKLSPEYLQFMEAVAEFHHDPLGFVEFAWPWGEPGTPLENECIDDWQIENLTGIGERLRADPFMPVRDAVAMGNGGGKSTNISHLIFWAMSTFPECRGTITAGTEAQLRTKLIPEVTKWRNMLIPGLRDLFVQEATSIYHPLFPKTWRCDFIPWSKANPESTAGLHNSGKRLFVVLDEASGIDDIILETLDGSLTDEGTEIFHFLRGNPTRAEGRFKDCFTGPEREHWLKAQVDTRTCRKVNKRLVDQWEKLHSFDSDFFRIHVRGVFPRQSPRAYFSSEIVAEARKRAPVADWGNPLIAGLDAGERGDRTMMSFRRGFDARTIPAVRMPYDNGGPGHLHNVAIRAAAMCQEKGVKVLFVDVGGMGLGLCEILENLGAPVVRVSFGDDPVGAWPVEEIGMVRDRKAEMHAALNSWLKKGGAIEDSDELAADFAAPWSYLTTGGAMFIEPKDHLKGRGLASPDWMESLALTFAAPVLDVETTKAIKQKGERMRRARGESAGGYDPVEYMRKLLESADRG